MLNSDGLDVQQGSDPALVRWSYQRVVYQITLLLGRFFGQNMTMEGVLPLDFPRAGQLKTLFGARVCFYFWHCTKTAFVEKIVNRPQRYKKSQ